MAWTKIADGAEISYSETGEPLELRIDVDKHYDLLKSILADKNIDIEDFLADPDYFITTSIDEK